ncbi:hypothetical protein [Novosphingobium sp. 9]|uniref:hypothetical protein n=1 Tax=Novosphingobium sp. 9 TaxID=2025349 RepID=UPI0021B55D44|nr:hypothetical protein [Novosphingobium sp. 9]
MIQANWLVFAAALVIGLLIAWWLFGRATKPKARHHRPDVLDEGAAPAQRNQALIDSPPAARFDAPVHVDPPAMAGTMAGIGEIIAVAAQDEIDAAEPPVVPDGEVEKNAAPLTPSTPIAPDSAATAEGDDLRRIKGLGPKLVALLHGLGVTRYAQIAAWSDADLDDLDTKLGAFAGRPRRDSWVEQARLLSGGDTGAYEAKFGKL